MGEEFVILSDIFCNPVAGEGGKILDETSGFGVCTLNDEELPLPTFPGVLANLGLLLAGSFRFWCSCGITKVVLRSSRGWQAAPLAPPSRSNAEISSLRILSPLATSTTPGAATVSNASSTKEELLESCLCLAGSLGGSGVTFFKSAPHPKLALKKQIFKLKQFRNPNQKRHRLTGFAKLETVEISNFILNIIYLYYYVHL